MFRIRKIKARDRDSIYKLLQQNEILNSREIELEIVRIDQVLFKTSKDKNWVIIAETTKNNLAGYASYGVEPMSKSTYHIYKILVSPLTKDKGVDDILLTFIEEDVKRRQGRLIVTEVSSADRHQCIRNFYLAHDYVHKSQIKSYYDQGVDQFYLVKELS